MSSVFLASLDVTFRFNKYIKSPLSHLYESFLLYFPPENTSIYQSGNLEL